MLDNRVYRGAQNGNVLAVSALETALLCLATPSHISVVSLVPISPTLLSVNSTEVVGVESTAAIFN